MGREKVILDPSGFRQALESRLCQPLLSEGFPLSNVILVGIYTRGVYLAHRIQRWIRRKTGVSLPVGEIDINLYRDDFVRRFDLPQVRRTNLPDVTDKGVLLVDDVLFTGRTARSALSAILDVGRPSFVKLMVLVQRPGREMPICADFVGVEVDPGDRRVYVELKEVDGKDRVVVR